MRPRDRKEDDSTVSPKESEGNHLEPKEGNLKKPVIENFTGENTSRLHSDEKKRNARKLCLIAARVVLATGMRVS